MNPIILYDSILRRGALSATSTASGYDVYNLADLHSYKKWKAGNASTNNIDIDLSSMALLLETGGNLLLEGAGAGNILLEGKASGAESCNCVGIYNHNLGTIGATIKIQYVNSGYQTAVTINPDDDDPILVTFDAHSAIEWRIELSGMSEAPEIGVIFLGTYLEIPDPPDAPTTPEEESIRVNSEISEAGHLLGADIQYYNKFINHRWSKAPNITRTFYSTYFIPFWDYAKRLSYFFYAWDLTNRADDIWYGHLDPGMVRKEVLSLLTYSDELELQIRTSA